MYKRELKHSNTTFHDEGHVERIMVCYSDVSVLSAGNYRVIGEASSEVVVTNWLTGPITYIKGSERLIWSKCIVNTIYARRTNRLTCWIKVVIDFICGIPVFFFFFFFFFAYV